MQVAQRTLAVELAAALLQAYPEPFNPDHAVMAPSRSSRRSVRPLPFSVPHKAAAASSLDHASLISSVMECTQAD